MSLFLLAIASTAGGGTIYVDAGASPGGDGSSWGTAYKYLQDALYKPPTSGDEIWVAEGIYKPDQGAGVMLGDRTATFQLINGVTIKGGYVGFGAQDPSARDIAAYQTIISGDLNGDDIEVPLSHPHELYATELYNGPTRRENSSHVVTGNGTDGTAILDGFIITAGGNMAVGGGIYNVFGSPTLSNCTFKANCATQWGGAMYNASSSPVITNCAFIGNVAFWMGGGGIYNDNESDPILINCIFKRNISYDHHGGGIYNDASDPMIVNCQFVGNSGSSGGGGIYNYSSCPVITNCEFSGNGNWACYGGGIRNDSSNPILTNCTFSGNMARTGGGIFNYYESSPTLTNCILWGDTPEEVYGGTPVITYCDVQGGWSGESNIDLDPRFMDPGYWDDNGTPDDVRDDFWAEGNYHLQPASPCIDAGDNSAVPPSVLTDLDGNRRIVGGAVDMGAYECQGPQEPRILYVDDDGPGDPGPGDTAVSDPLEDGTQMHPFDAIQEAIDAAWHGDTVIAADGTYAGEGNYNINLLGKAITVRSQNGPSSCIIDCQNVQGHRGFTFHSGEDQTTIVDGFTITNGKAGHGAAISCINSSPKVLNSIISANGGSQGCIACYDCSPTIANNTIVGNYGADELGGIFCVSSTPLIIGNIISENSGGGIYCGWDSSAVIANNFITGNSGPGGGVECFGSTTTIVNNTIVDNPGPGIRCNGGSPLVTNCIVWGNSIEATAIVNYSCVEGGFSGTGNISDDPLFVNPANGDFRLQANSPCIDTGDNAALPPDVADIDGKQTTAVFDYKRKGKSFSWENLYYGLDMQLAIYLLALKNGSIRGKKVDSSAGAFYLPIEAKLKTGTLNKAEQKEEKFDYTTKGFLDGEYVTDLDNNAGSGWNKYYNFYMSKDGPYGNFKTSGALKPGQLEKVLDMTRSRIAELAGFIFAGRINITPYRINKKSPCVYCPYDAVCRFDWQINRYNLLSPMNKELVLEMMGGVDGG